MMQMKNQEVLDKIKKKKALLKEEINRIPDAKVFYKWFIDGELSKGGAEEVNYRSL